MKWEQGRVTVFGRRLQSWTASSAVHTYAVTRHDNGFFASYRLPILNTRATFLHDERPFATLAEAQKACEDHAKRTRN